MLEKSDKDKIAWLLGNYWNSIFKKWTVSHWWAKATTQTWFPPPSFPNNDLWMDPANFRTDQAESGPVGPLFISVCLADWCCPFRLQLHFQLKQVIVVAVPRDPAEGTFKAVPFCSFYSRQTMAPLDGPLRQQELGSIVLGIKHCHQPNQSQHEPWDSKYVWWLFMWDGMKKQQA